MTGDGDDQSEASDDTAAGDGPADTGADGGARGSGDGLASGEDPVSGDDRVELALDLIAHLEHDELPLSAVVDRIETVTSDPALTREILDTAELRGLVERDGARIRTRTGGTFVRFESQVVTKEGDFDCRRCGASLSTGHFIRFESGELGPFGSSCVRKVTGRE
jgi:hypothetical protein